MLKIKPSAAHRVVGCPGSLSLEDGRPDTPSHPVREEGTAIAWALERVLMSWTSARPLELSGFVGQQCPANGVFITEDMVAGGMTYLADIWNESSAYPEGLRVEKRVSAHQYVEGLSGRIDCGWVSPDGSQLIIWDFKWGFTPVEAFMNWQLISYALGMVTDSTQNITLIIVQPNGSRARDPVDRWPTSREILFGCCKKLFTAALEARGSHAQTHAGSHCRNCKAAPYCRTLQAAGWRAKADSGAAIADDMDELQIAYELEAMHQAGEAVKHRKDALDGLAISRITAGKIIPGHEHTPGLGNARWTKPGQYIKMLGDLFGLDLTEQKACTPKQAVVRGIPQEIIDAHTERLPTAPKLKRTDPQLARKVFTNGK